MCVRETVTIAPLYATPVPPRGRRCKSLMLMELDIVNQLEELSGPDQ